ncbi:MAG: MltR family transcriptional regulator [Chloroflexota bacterium]
MTKKIYPRFFDENEWTAFSNEFAHESDRASIILGAAYLDDLLEQLIAGFLVDDQNAMGELLDGNRPYAPLSTFSARITAAYCLGLIDYTQYQDLKTIKRIRNLFAHGLQGLSFQNENIIQECQKLKTHRMAHIPKDVREEFLLTVLILSTDIQIQARQALKERRSRPSYYDFIEKPS